MPSIEDESREVLKTRMLEARGDMDERRQEAFTLLENVYVNPRNAFLNMVDVKGTDADLIKRVEERPASFGTLHGYSSVREYFSLDGMQERKVSNALAKQLPEVIKAAVDAEHKYLNLKRAYEGRYLSSPPFTREMGGREI